MRKLLLLLLGLLLIALLASIAFTNKSLIIKNDLVSKVQSAYSQNNLAGVQVGIKGEDYGLTRIITLTGSHQIDRDRIIEMAKNIDGVCDVEHKSLTADLIGDLPASVPENFLLSVKKSDTGKVVLSGFVGLKDHKKLIDKAGSIFGSANIENNLKDAKGAPESWFKTAKLGLMMLDSIESGSFDIDGNEFSFDGGVELASQRELLVKALKQGLNSHYVGVLNIEVLEEVPVKEVPVKEVLKKKELASVTAHFCQTQFETLLAKNKIRFGYDSSDVSPESFSLLKDLIDVMEECPDAKVTIQAYSDSIGSYSFNLKLSEQRAKKVKEYLVKNGVAASKLTAIGRGESNPIADNASEEGREKNRRVEFNIKGIK